MNSII
jgi:hypothetical protein